MDLCAYGQNCFTIEENRFSAPAECCCPSQTQAEELSPSLTHGKESINFEGKQPAPIFHFSRFFCAIGHRHIYLPCYRKHFSASVCLKNTQVTECTARTAIRAEALPKTSAQMRKAHWRPSRWAAPSTGVES